jgi:hypothetical protein
VAFLPSCKELERLAVHGSKQGSLFVEALVPNLSSIKELRIFVQELSPEAGDALKGCKRLENLVIRGRLLFGFFEHILSPPLTNSLKILSISNSEGSEDLSDKDGLAILAARTRFKSIDHN